MSAIPILGMGNNLVRRVDAPTYLKLRIDPIGTELDAMNARALIVGMIPARGAVHITCRCNSDADRITLLRQLSTILANEAKRLELGGRPKLVLAPGGA